MNYYFITYFKDSRTTPLSIACENAVHKAVNFISESFKVKVQRLDLDEFKDAYAMWGAMMRNGKKNSNIISNLLKDNSSEPYKPFKELGKAIIRKSDYTVLSILNSILEKVPLKEPEKKIQKAIDLKNKFEALLGENSIIISAGYPTVAPYHHQQMFSFFDFVYFGIYNVLRLPVTSCPMGLCPQTGLPVGIQIVSNDKCDHLTISLAEYFEKNLGGWIPAF